MSEREAVGLAMVLLLIGVFMDDLNTHAVAVLCVALSLSITWKKTERV